MAALAGLPAPPNIDGTDLSPLFASGGAELAAPLKAAAFSQFPRCPDQNPVTHHICFETNDNGFDFMGFSIRVQDWRYTCALALDCPALPTANKHSQLVAAIFCWLALGFAIGLLSMPAVTASNLSLHRCRQPDAGH